ncbi:Transmembrane protein, partial [Phytophthora megakarya]
TFLTIWDVVRSQWLWLGVPLLEKVPAAAAKYIGALFMLEIETDGFDATLFGLGVTAQDVGRPFATVLTKSVNGFFDVERTFIEEDDHHVRSQVTIVYVIAYVINLLAAAFVLLLPTQKAELHRLKREGVQSKRWGIITLILLGFALCWTLMTNILSLFDSTKCLRIAGGSGC